MSQTNIDDANDTTAASLGERILAAARLAACVHLEMEFLDRFSSRRRQQARVGGADHDDDDRITDDALPTPTPTRKRVGLSAESEAA